MTVLHLVSNGVIFLWLLSALRRLVTHLQSEDKHLIPRVFIVTSGTRRTLVFFLITDRISDPMANAHYVDPLSWLGLRVR
jgi:hypothetical protein